MLNLKTIFRNLFNTREISDANLKKFSQTHISRLTSANTGGTYNDILADVQAAYTPFANAINAEDFAHSQQQGNTIAADNIFYEFKTLISQKEGFVRGIWGVNSPQYQDFFPEGLSEYSQATKTNVEMLMSRIVAAATTHNAELNPDFLLLFQGIESNYLAARTAQLTKIGEVETLKTNSSNARQVLTTQLMKNLLIIASNNVGNTSMLEDYFDQSFIRSNIAPDDGSIGGVIAANTTINIESEGLTIDTEITITNSGNTPLKFGIEQTATTAVENGIVVAEGATFIATYLQLLGGNPQGSSFLNVTNFGATAGAYSILIQ